MVPEMEMKEDRQKAKHASEGKKKDRQWTLKGEGDRNKNNEETRGRIDRKRVRLRDEDEF